MVFFLEPGGADTLWLSLDRSHLVGQTLLQQKRIQFLERSHRRDGHQKIASAITHAVLHAAFFMALTWGTKMALEQIVASEGQKSSLFLPLVSNQNVLHRGFQIV